MSRKELDDIINKLGYTKIPNAILDLYLKNLKGAELIMIVAICRKTLGFGKPKDGIALSTFQDITGCSRSTVTKALKNLEKRHLIIKEKTSGTNRYGLNFSKLMPEKELVQESNSGFMIEPQIVRNSDHQLVQKVDTQKKDQNKPKETTTSRIDESVLEIIEAWDKRFELKVNIRDKTLINNIVAASKEFSLEQIITAMDNRLDSEYYKDLKPELLNNPKCFFNYESTIRTDMRRKSNRLFTYKEMLNLKFNKGYVDDQFKIRYDKRDRDGNPLRELIQE